MAGNTLTRHSQKLEIHHRNEISVYLIIFLTLLQAELFIHNTCKSIINGKLLKILMTRKQVIF